MSLDSGLTLDARRAAFLPSFSVLAVADLHLGYAWAQRTRGLLLPVSTPDLSVPRLAALVNDYAPETVVLLGDIVHRAVALPALQAALTGLCDALAGRRILFCLGNHDRQIERLVADWKLPVSVTSEYRLGRFRLRHGDDRATAVDSSSFALEGESPLAVIGHEHPALELGDGVASRTRAPCFLVSGEVVILPAFSDWAAGCVVGRDSFLGTTARSTRFRTAYACLGPRLLPIPLGQTGNQCSPIGARAPRQGR